MNQKKNTKILLILIIIIVIIMLAGVGILVFATDIFKSDKEMFFKYMADIGDSKKGFIDDGLKQYFEKKNCCFNNIFVLSCYRRNMVKNIIWIFDFSFTFI